MIFFLKKISLIFFFVLANVAFTFAQDHFDLTGEIIDAKSKLPLSFANVFIANTTLGVNSDGDGKFLIRDVPKGNCEMVFSFLGYETLIKKINVNEYSAKRKIEVILKPSSVILAEVEVKALSKKKRKKFLKKFTQAFLGETDNAKSCKILNPEVIDFQKEKGKVIATAQDLIEIENRATGYNVKFLLEKFEIENRQVIYAGKPLFQELEPQNNKEKKSWKNNRSNTYKGSPRHFYEALVQGNLKKQGFRIYHAQQKSANKFHNISSTSTSSILKDGANPKTKYLRFEDFLKVVYVSEKNQTKQHLGNSLTGLGQKAEKDLIEQTKTEVGASTSHPTSYLFARKTAMKISSKGRLLEPELMLQYGDWADEGVADLLPFDYFPEEN